MNTEQVHERIAEFIDQHAQSRVYVLAHAELEDFNLSHSAIEDALQRITSETEQWITHQLTETDSYARFAHQAYLWSEVWALWELLNWLRWDVPNEVLEAIE